MSVRAYRSCSASARKLFLIERNRVGEAAKTLVIYF